jgi:hypothetical protein
MKYKWFVACAMAFSALAHAQTPWPAVQAESYPMASGMQLIRHEQSVLLGESDMQTGLFYAHLSHAHREAVQNLLIADARRKGWDLQSAMHFGHQSLMAFAKGGRLLDIRLSNQSDGVDAMYSVALNQQPAPIAQPQLTQAPVPVQITPLQPSLPARTMEQSSNGRPIIFLNRGAADARALPNNSGAR